MFLNKVNKNTDTAFKKAVALKNTLTLLKQKASQNPEFPVETCVMLETYNSYLINENLPQKSNITRFGEMILYHIKGFEIHKNNHDMNAFILKAHYVKKTLSDQTFDCSMDFFKNTVKLVTPIRKAFSSFDLSLEKHFDQNRFYTFQTNLIDRFDN